MTFVLHTTSNREGKPPQAGIEHPGGPDALRYCAALFQEVYGLAPDDAALTWRVPFKKIVAGVQTVGGIAKLADVTRQTVHRRGIAVGGIMAVSFVIEERHGGMVRHSSREHPLNPLHPDDNLKSVGRLPVGLPEVIAKCRAYFGEHVTRKIWKLPEGKPGQELTPLQARWKQRQLVRQLSRPRRDKGPPDANSEPAPDEVLKGFDAFGYRYRPQNRVTVTVLCSVFQIPRRQFNRWKDTLAGGELRQLTDAMSGKLFGKGAGAGTGLISQPMAEPDAAEPIAYGLDDVAIPARRKASGPSVNFDIASVEESLARQGWKEPGE